MTICRSPRLDGLWVRLSAVLRRAVVQELSSYNSIIRRFRNQLSSLCHSSGDSSFFWLMSLVAALLRDQLPPSFLEKPSGKLRQVWIAVRPDLFTRAGSRSDPYDGSTATKFDELLMPNTG